MTGSSVYTEIGGRDAIEAVVEDFYTRVLDDDQLVEYFEDSDVGELKAHQVQFLVSVTGGPVEYTGQEMREAHAHLGITETDFKSVAVHLETALRMNGVSESHVEQVMADVADLKQPILNQ